jgi:hypothetical protein
MDSKTGSLREVRMRASTFGDAAQQFEMIWCYDKSHEIGFVRTWRVLAREVVHAVAGRGVVDLGERSLRIHSAMLGAADPSVAPFRACTTIRFINAGTLTERVASDNVQSGIAPLYDCRKKPFCSDVVLFSIQRQSAPYGQMP